MAVICTYLPTYLPTTIKNFFCNLINRPSFTKFTFYVSLFLKITQFSIGNITFTTTPSSSLFMYRAPAFPILISLEKLKSLPLILFKHCKTVLSEKFLQKNLIAIISPWIYVLEFINKIASSRKWQEKKNRNDDNNDNDKNQSKSH